jgi:hypothetical protein
MHLGFDFMHFSMYSLIFYLKYDTLRLGFPCYTFEKKCIIKSFLGVI